MNTLVTTLKGTVNNDSLLKLGEMVIPFKTKATGSYNFHSGNQPIKGIDYIDNIELEIKDGEIYFNNSSKKLSLSGSETGSINITAANVEFVLSLISKYNIYSVRESEKCVFNGLNIADLKYLTSLHSFGTMFEGNDRGYIYGDVADLPNNVFTWLSLKTDVLHSVYGDYGELCSRITNPDGTCSLRNVDLQSSFVNTGICGDLSLTPKDTRAIYLGQNTQEGRVYNTWTEGVRSSENYEILGTGEAFYYGFKTAADVSGFIRDNANCKFTEGRTSARYINIFTEQDTFYDAGASVKTAAATLRAKGMLSVKVNGVEIPEP